jgi:hypothetical protein
MISNYSFLIISIILMCFSSLDSLGDIITKDGVKIQFYMKGKKKPMTEDELDYLRTCEPKDYIDRVVFTGTRKSKYKEDRKDKDWYKYFGYEYESNISVEIYQCLECEPQSDCEHLRDKLKDEIEPDVVKLVLSKKIYMWSLNKFQPIVINLFPLINDFRYHRIIVVDNDDTIIDLMYERTYLCDGEG